MTIPRRSGFRPFTLDRPRRTRLSWCITLYAGALGAASVLISVLARTDPQLDPHHLPFLPSSLLALAGVTAAVIMTWPTVYYFGERASVSRALLFWLALGLVFGFTLPFATGLIMPLSGVFIDFSRGTIDVGDIFSQILSALFRAPLNAFISGTLSTFTGLIVGVLWGLGAWGIDRFNASADPNLSRYATWALTISLAAGVLLAMAFVPPETLARLN